MESAVMLTVILNNRSNRSERLTISNLKLEIRTKYRYSLHSVTQIATACDACSENGIPG